MYIYQIFTKNLPLKGGGGEVWHGLRRSSLPLPPHPTRSPRLRRRRGASLTAPLPPPGGKGQYWTDVLGAAAAAWEPTSAAAGAAGQGVAIALEGVSVLAGGHTILTDLNLTLAPGSHVAIVGPSGAGKSSLVGLLLGWHRPATGRVLVEGRPLDDQHLAWVRQITAWVDPAIQLWNRPLLDNICYGVADTPASLVAQAVAEADLRGVLDRLPEGLQTPLG
jgi:ABC-type multidrug transport system fused ATPase/permease subunit